MSIVTVLQGLLVTAAVIAAILLTQRWAEDPRRGGDPARRDLAARVGRAWMEIVHAHEVVARRMRPWEDDDLAGGRTASPTVTHSARRS